MDPAAAVGGLESEGVAEKSTSEDADADVVLGLLDRRVLLVCLRLASSDTDASTIRSSSNSTPGSSNKVESARTGTVAGATGAAGASREEAEAWGEAVCGNAGPLALPKLLDLASLYGPANPLLVSQLLSNAITLNPKGLTHALANTGSVVLSVLESLRCSALELSQSSSSDRSGNSSSGKSGQNDGNKASVGCSASLVQQGSAAARAESACDELRYLADLSGGLAALLEASPAFCLEALSSPTPSTTNGAASASASYAATPLSTSSSWPHALMLAAARCYGTTVPVLEAKCVRTEHRAGERAAVAEAHARAGAAAASACRAHWRRVCHVALTQAASHPALSASGGKGKGGGKDGGDGAFVEELLSTLLDDAHHRSSAPVLLPFATMRALEEASSLLGDYDDQCGLTVSRKGLGAAPGSSRGVLIWEHPLLAALAQESRSGLEPLRIQHLVDALRNLPRSSQPHLVRGSDGKSSSSSSSSRSSSAANGVSSKAETSRNRSGPTEGEMAGLVDAVQAIVPGLGEGFVEACLAFHSFDPTQVDVCLSYT